MLVVRHRRCVCRFRVSVCLGGEFEPGELTVTTLDRRLVVAAARDEAGPGRRAASRQFRHEFDLPDAVDPHTVTASMEPGGRLVIEAPLLHAVNL